MKTFLLFSTFEYKRSLKKIMYYYFDDLGNKIWTSNELLAYKRSEKYNSDIYSVKIPINNITI